MPIKQGLQKRYFSGGKTNPGYPPAHPRSCRAVLPVKAPELGGLSFPFAPRTCTKITAVTMHECSCFLSRELQRAPPLKRGSICSDAKAQWLPCPVQSPPRQFQFYSEQMDFPALGNIPEKKKKKKKHFTVAVTHAPDQHGSAHTTLGRSIITQKDAKHYFGTGNPVPELAFASASSFLVYKAPFTLFYN